MNTDEVPDLSRCTYTVAATVSFLSLFFGRGAAFLVPAWTNKRYMGRRVRARGLQGVVGRVPSRGAMLTSAKKQ